VRNAAQILARFPGAKVLVVSAMGKTTNALEEVARHFYKQTGEALPAIQPIKSYHAAIIDGLWEQEGTRLPEVEKLFQQLETRSAANRL
jgi:aspartate kinase